MEKLFCLLCLLLGIGCMENTPQSSPETLGDEIFLWPGTAPGSEFVDIVENVFARDSSEGPCYFNRIVEKVTRPSLKAFLPENPNGQAVILCPGGGYRRMAYDKEGYTLARWFNGQGITAFVLKYRLPLDGHRDRHLVPLQDAQRAMRYLKAHAENYQLDPHKIGIMGASAGGHLAATLSVHHDWPVYDRVDTLDALSARPAFTILMYPVISFQDSLAHKGSRKNLLGEPFSDTLRDIFSPELHVDAETPAAFVFHAKTDKSVPSGNSEIYAAALEKAGVPVSLYLYPDGEHGMSMCEADSSSFGQWPAELSEWLMGIGH